MKQDTNKNRIVIAPQIYVSLEPQDSVYHGGENEPRRTEIPMIWTQDGNDFRLDIDLPDLSILDVFFFSPVGSLYVNGETIWEDNTAHTVQMAGAQAVATPGGLRLTCTSGGSMHILARSIADEDSQSNTHAA